PDQPIPRVRIDGLPAEVAGYWSLWQIRLDGRNLRDSRVLPLFLHDDGRALLPTARSVWDALLEDRPSVEILGAADLDGSFGKLRSEAERHGLVAFEGL